MAYTKQTWVDNNLSYPVSAARMTAIENGIEAAANVADQGHRILTTAQRDALGTVTTGTIIYNSTTSRFEFYNGSAWDQRPFLYPATGSGSRNVQIDITGTNTVTVLTATITPQLTTSKVLITVAGHGYFTTGGDVSFGDKILRGATEVFGRTEFHYSSSTYAHFESWGVTWIDSPNTTSSTTYNYQIVGANRGSCGFARGGGSTGTSLQLVEIIN
jgi:hypothetical protein